ncbi:hypothetical protein [Okeania sp. SIO2B3]|uniref:hypothetical protein n=1 Tax=Okeania sp. SIO2B3 TaxID=2607784 RepID=UPI0013C09D9D|nr:hypothetical protein [Okeania sp. SIO2B3]NET46286.1 hypothetical protein [Okeania sp. SIO2B3]
MKKLVTKLLVALVVMMAFILVSPVDSAQAAEFCEVTETQPCVKTIDRGETLTANFDPGLDTAKTKFTNQSQKYNAVVAVQDHPPVYIQVQQTEDRQYYVGGTQSITFSNISEHSETPVEIFITGSQT